MQRKDSSQKFRPSWALSQDEIEIHDLANAITYAEIPLREFFSGIECVESYLIVPEIQSRRRYTSEEISRLKLCFPFRVSPEIRGITKDRLAKFPDLRSSTTLDRKKEILRILLSELKGGEFLPFFYSTSSDKRSKERSERIEYVRLTMESDIAARKIFARDSHGIRLVSSNEGVDLRLEKALYVSKKEAWDYLSKWGVGDWWEKFLNDHPDAEFDKIPWANIEQDTTGENEVKPSTRDMFDYAINLMHSRIDRMLDGDFETILPSSTVVAEVVASVREGSIEKGIGELETTHRESESIGDVDIEMKGDGTRLSNFGEIVGTNSDDFVQANLSNDSPQMVPSEELVEDDELWTLPEIQERFKMGESQAWRMVGSKLSEEPFPEKTPGLGRSSVWKKSEVLRWHQKFIALKSTRS